MAADKLENTGPKKAPISPPRVTVGATRKAGADAPKFIGPQSIAPKPVVQKPVAAKPAGQTAAPPDATAYAREAIRLFALGVDLHRRGRLADAARAYGRALLFNPTLADVHNNLGVALRAQGKLEAAVACYRRAGALKPEAANYQSNMGNALRELGRLEEAAQAMQQALRLAPGASGILYNFGLVLRDMGRTDTALNCFDAVLKADPDHAEAHFDRALTWLQAGDLKRGFAEFEWRRKLKRNPPRPFKQPPWNGGDLAGKTLLLHREPGLGDAIQFARYIPLAKKKGGTVILECQAELARLLETVAGVDRVVIHGGPLPAFDVHAPLLSLPRLLSGGASVPYLRPPAINAIGIGRAGAGALKVGIVWAGEGDDGKDGGGNGGHDGGADRHRSCPFAHFLELAGVSGVALYSLQKGAARRDLDRHAAEALVTDIGQVIADYADAAAAIAKLDLVVGVDGPMVHLAGALGVPTWTLLSDIPDWRWGRTGDATPWYPSMRLFRQKTLGDWAGAMADAREALGLAARAGGVRRPRPA